MTDQNMFSEEGTSTEPQTTEPKSSDPTPSSTNPFEDKLKDIVNEKGEPKYRDVESALEALRHSQEFIETLKSEKQQEADRIKQLELELEKRTSVEEAVERLTKGRDPEMNNPDHGSSKGMDADAIEQLVQATLTKQKQGEVAEGNLNKVVSKLSELYGEQAKEVIGRRARELETTPNDLEKLARQNPTMALHLLSGVETKSKDPGPSKSSITPSHSYKDDNEPPTFEKSLVGGGVSNKDLLEGWRAIQKYTHKKIGVEN